MDILKKYLMLVLAFCLILASVNVPRAEAAEQDAPRWYYGANFDDVEDGYMPSGNVVSSYNAKSNKLEVVSVPGKTDKSIHFALSSLDDFHVTHQFKEVMTGKVVAQFTIRTENNMGCDKYFYIYDSTGASAGMFVINSSGAIIDTNSAAIGLELYEGKFATVSLAMDFDTQLYDIYVNYKLRAKDIPMNGKIKDCARYRVHIRNVKEGSAAELYLSDVKFYEGKRALTPEEIAETEWSVSTESASVSSDDLSLIMNNKVAFFDGTSRYYADGIKDIDASGSSPYIQGDELYAPVRCTAEALGGTVSYVDSTASAEVVIAGKKATFTPGSSVVPVEGKEAMELASPIQNIGGRIYAPVSVIAKLAEKEYFYDSTGLAIVSNIKLDYNWRDDSNKLSAIIRSLIFDRPTGEQILAMVETRHPGNAHPRLFGTQADFDRIKAEIATSEIKKKWFEDVKAKTEKLMTAIPVVYGTTDGVRMRVQSAQVASIVGNCSFMYKITGEERYAERAWEEMNTIFQWNDWHPDHFLDTGQFMNGVAIGYDFLYDWMTPAQRELARNNIVEKGLNAIMNMYQSSSKNWVWNTPDNWTLECNSGAIMAALAICDEERDVSLKVLTNAMKSIELAVMAYAPDGPWYEGVVYWQLSTETFVEAAICLETSTGSTFGFLKAPGIAETGWYPYAMTGVSIFNFSDAYDLDYGTLDTKEMFYLAEKTNDPALANMRYRIMQEYDISADYREFFYSIGDPAGDETNLNLDFYHRVAETVSMRNNWSVNSMLFAAMHSADNAANHAQLDTGTFVLDSFGDRFASDLGRESYNLNGQGQYRDRAEGHNVLWYNPDGRIDDQVPDAYCWFQEYEHNNVSAYAITDLTDSNADYVTSAKRGMKTVNGRTAIVIQDEVKSDRENEVYWFMHTKADIAISEDGKSAILDINGNKMEARILTDEGEFSVMDAKPLDISPKVNGQSENEGYRKLAIHFENVKDFDVCVCFTPLVYARAGKISYPEVVPLDEWELEDPSKVSVGVLPTLSEIKVDGKPIAGFASDNYFYTLPIKKATSPMPNVEATSDNGNVEVVYPDEWPGVIEIRVTNDYYTNVYGIRFNIPPASLADEGYEELDIEEVTAGEVPQAANYPRNTLDNDFETRYSCENPAWICYDLGKETEVNYVSLAFYSGTERKNKFAIEVSNDGTNFTTVWDGLSSGTTDGLENYDIGSVKARYIRISATGLMYNNDTKVTEGGWFSPTEFKAYVKGN